MHPRTLSKSDFKLARTCATKLYYRESGYPDSRQDDPYLAMLAEGGYMVAALAKAQRPGGIELEYGRDHAADFARTRELLRQDRVTLFEATLLAGHRLARVDILEKDGDTVRLIEVKAKSIDSAEHAASIADGKRGVMRSARKPYPVNADWRKYLEDVTYQAILLEKLFPALRIEARLLLVDKTRRSAIDRAPMLFGIIRKVRPDGRSRAATAGYAGTAAELAGLDLLMEVDVTAEVAELRDEVEAASAAFEATLHPVLERTAPAVGPHCRDCEYRDGDASAPDGFGECWGPLAHVTPHVLELYQGSRVLGPGGGPLSTEMAAAGRASLFDIDEAVLVKKDGTPGKLDARRLIQIRHTRSNSPFLGGGLITRMQAVEYPLHFLDFETSRLALPYHTGMAPYGLVAFQWSCHTIAGPGARPTHAEWINDVDLWPNADFAQSLRARIGDEGTVVAWAGHERATMMQIADSLAEFGHDIPGLAEWLRDTAETRMLDLNALTLEHFFHPGMGGRTSIKIVLDALWRADSAMRSQFADWTGAEGDAECGPYASLPPVEIAGVPQDVHEGTGAMWAYQEMMYGEHRKDDATREGWKQLLRQYCRLDTLAMVMVWEYWRRLTGAG
jgi:hypothetical protein